MSNSSVYGRTRHGQLYVQNEGQLLELELFFMKNTYLVIANILQEASDQGQPRLKNCNVII